MDQASAFKNTVGKFTSAADAHRVYWPTVSAICKSPERTVAVSLGVAGNESTGVIFSVGAAANSFN